MDLSPTVDQNSLRLQVLYDKEDVYEACSFSSEDEEYVRFICEGWCLDPEPFYDRPASCISSVDLDVCQPSMFEEDSLQGPDYGEDLFPRRRTRVITSCDVKDLVGLEAFYAASSSTTSFCLESPEEMEMTPSSPRTCTSVNDARKRRRKFVMSDNQLYHPEPGNSECNKLLMDPKSLDHPLITRSTSSPLIKLQITKKGSLRKVCKELISKASIQLLVELPYTKRKAVPRSESSESCSCESTSTSNALSCSSSVLSKSKWRPWSDRSSGTSSRTSSLSSFPDLVDGGSAKKSAELYGSQSASRQKRKSLGDESFCCRGED